MAKQKAKRNHHLYQNQHGYWYFQYKVKGSKRYKFSLETRQATKAREFRDSYLEEIRLYGHIRKPEPATKTFGEIALEWVEWKMTKIGASIRQYTFEDLYLYELNRRILPKFATKPIKDIDFVDIDKFVGSLKKSNGQMLSGSTKYNIMVPFRGIMKFAMQKGYIEKNPID